MQYRAKNKDSTFALVHWRSSRGEKCRVGGLAGIIDRSGYMLSTRVATGSGYTNRRRLQERALSVLLLWRRGLESCHDSLSIC